MDAFGRTGRHLDGSLGSTTARGSSDRIQIFDSFNVKMLSVGTGGFNAGNIEGQTAAQMNHRSATNPRRGEALCSAW
jgi:hypothetical protein